MPFRPGLRKAVHHQRLVTDEPCGLSTVLAVVSVKRRRESKGSVSKNLLEGSAWETGPWFAKTSTNFGINDTAAVGSASVFSVFLSSNAPYLATVGTHVCERLLEHAEVERTIPRNPLPKSKGVK